MLSRLLLKTTGKQSVPKYLSRAPTRSRILSSGILNSLHKYNRALLDRSSVSTPFQGYRSFHSPSELATMSIDRRDYTPPAYLVPSVDLKVYLNTPVTRVLNTFKVKRNPNRAFPEGTPHPLVLNGNSSLIDLKSVKVNGAALSESQYKKEDQQLTIPAECLGIAGQGEEAEVQIDVEEKPEENTTLEGLYKSGTTFCTQMEAEGFRNFVYHVDRPDVTSKYKVYMEADKEHYPVLLSNGDLIEKGDIDGNRHWAIWEDPFYKPSYLFALVATDKSHISETLTTRSGREVEIRVFADKKDIDKCYHAMKSVNMAIQWDEIAYNREYDSSVFNLVAIDDFNSGAMENKTLNIFNTKYILADPKMATDRDFNNILEVVGHEYFHNWTGNRVTLRDWLQLTLKEGLTVFREEEYASDHLSRPLRRIEKVIGLRAAQFSEDKGSMAHPVRPDKVMGMNNLYTPTVYEKGAEVIRASTTLLGPAAFRKGTEIYFERHDGDAVTCEDWVSALEDALVEHTGNKVSWKTNIVDEENWLENFKINFGAAAEWSGGSASIDEEAKRRLRLPMAQFRLWYSTPGTPQVFWRGEWDSNSGKFKLYLSQRVPITPNEENKGEKPPLHIPIRFGLLGPDGRDVKLVLSNKSQVSDPRDPSYGQGIAGSISGATGSTTKSQDWGDEYVILHLTQRHQVFEFCDLNDLASKARSNESKRLFPDEEVKKCPVVPSLLRGFSAPVRLQRNPHAGTDKVFEHTTSSDGDDKRENVESLFQLAFDSDPFNRWEAGNKLSTEVVLEMLDTVENAGNCDRLSAFGTNFLAAARQLLQDENADKATVARIIALPPLSVLTGEACLRSKDGVADPIKVAEARELTRRHMAHELHDELVACVERLSTQLGDMEFTGDYEYSLDLNEQGIRTLRSVVVSILISPLCETPMGRSPSMKTEEMKFNPVERMATLLRKCENMTEADAAFTSLMSLPSMYKERSESIDVFYSRFCHESLAVDSWLRTQAIFGSLDEVRKLTQHPDFLNWKNPNKVRSVIGGFVRGNVSRFYAYDGSGFDFIKDAIALLDRSNPHVASNVANVFSSVTQLPPKQRDLITEKVNQLLSSHNSGEQKLTGGTYEVLSKVASSVSSTSS